MGFFLKGLAVIAFGVVFQHVVKVGLVMGFLKHVYNHSPGPCHLVPNIKNGSEDIQSLRSGLAIISSGYKNPPQSHKATHEGALYTFDFNNPEAGATKLDTDIVIYNPHGLSIWEDADTGKVVLFLVNHAKDGERIEKFEFEESSRTLKHIKSITSPIFFSLNDVVATGPDTFYATNYLRTQNPLTQHLEIMLLMHVGSVVYYDGRVAHYAITGLQAPNGINKSPDRKFLYIAHPVSESISIYKIKSDTTLKLVQRYSLGTLPDNIDVGDDGSLWVGAHAIGHMVGEYIEDHTKESPSQVLRLKLDQTGHVTSTEEVYMGSLLSGSTVGVYHQGALLVGSIFTDTMYCEVLHLD